MWTEQIIANLASIGVMVATLILAFFTYRSVRQARDAQRALVRPVLIPASIPNTEDLINANERSIDISNVGNGVAVDIWGVLFPFSDPLPWIPPQLSLSQPLPLPKGSTKAMTFSTGGTIFSSKDRVGKVQLAVPVELAPENGFIDPHDRRERVVARLTMTCRDSIGLRYSFSYDLDLLDRWIFVDSGSIVRKDLRDLDADKGSPPAPRRASPTA